MLNEFIAFSMFNLLIDSLKEFLFMKADGINMGPGLRLFAKQMFVFSARTEIYLRNRLLPILM